MFDWLKKKTGQAPEHQQTASSEHDASATVIPGLPPPSAQSDTPATIAHYRVVRLLGVGGMARVYVVEPIESPGQQYALKTMLEMQKADVELRERFQREVEIGLQLQHPNVCRMLETGTLDDGTPWLVMELLEGQVLSDYIEKLAPMPVALCKPLIEQILLGLQAIHEAHVIHRDLKPNNIFLTGEGVIKIMDFGIAKRKGQKNLTRTGTALGTPDYISPEQLFDTKNVDLRTDLFNVGLILYQMLTAQLPFEAPTVGEMLARLVKGPMTPVSDLRKDLPPGVAEWMARLLAHQPDGRYPSARAALDALPF